MGCEGVSAPFRLSRGKTLQKNDISLEVAQDICAAQIVLEQTLHEPFVFEKLRDYCRAGNDVGPLWERGADYFTYVNNFSFEFDAR